MRATIKKGVASGRITAPPSKSIAHRLLISAGLANGVSRISGVPRCEDVLATIDCLRALGAAVEWDGEDAIVRGLDIDKVPTGATLNCRESGSTLRFFLPICLLTGVQCTLIGSEKLLSRPLSVYEDLCREFGFNYRHSPSSLTVRGRLCASEIYLRGDVSSQFVTGLLFALPLCDGDSKIHLTTPLESRSYVDMTLDCLRLFSISAWFEDESTIYVPGHQRYSACDLSTEGDYSGAAFLLALNTLGGNVSVDGLNEHSTQGDSVCAELLQRLAEGYTEISLCDCPDLGPILFTAAAALHGARFTDTRRLRLKESDRVEAMANELLSFGADIKIEENAVTVTAAPLHTPKSVLCGHNDHRIVMSLAVLCTLYGGEIDDAEAISKSYPDFFEDLACLGIEVTRNEI